MCRILMEQRERLEEKLIARLEELKGICIAEGVAQAIKLIF